MLSWESIIAVVSFCLRNSSDDRLNRKQLKEFVKSCSKNGVTPFQYYIFAKSFMVAFKSALNELFTMSIKNAWLKLLSHFLLAAAPLSSKLNRWNSVWKNIFKPFTGCLLIKSSIKCDKREIVATDCSTPCDNLSQFTSMSSSNKENETDAENNHQNSKKCSDDRKKDLFARARARNRYLREVVTKKVEPSKDTSGSDVLPTSFVTPEIIFNENNHQILSCSPFNEVNPMGSYYNNDYLYKTSSGESSSSSRSSTFIAPVSILKNNNNELERNSTDSSAPKIKKSVSFSIDTI